MVRGGKGGVEVGGRLQTLAETDKWLLSFWRKFFWDLLRTYYRYGKY